jgi:hypothetical protein
MKRINDVFKTKDLIEPSADERRIHEVASESNKSLLSQRIYSNDKRQTLDAE